MCGSAPVGELVELFCAAPTPRAGVATGGVIAVFWSVALSTIAVAIGLGLYDRYEIDRGILTRAAERVDDAE